MEYFQVPKHQARNGSIIWNRVSKAWKDIRPISSFVKPQNWDELMSTSWWWCPLAPTIGPGRFSKARAAVRVYRNAWTQGRLMNFNEAATAFGLLSSEEGAWDSMIRNLRNTWGELLHPKRVPIKGEWIGNFPDNSVTQSTLVYMTCSNFEPRAGLGYHNVPLTVQIYKVMSHSASLEPIGEEMRRT